MSVRPCPDQNCNREVRHRQEARLIGAHRGASGRIGAHRGASGRIGAHWAPSIRVSGPFEPPPAWWEPARGKWAVSGVAWPAAVARLARAPWAAASSRPPRPLHQGQRRGVRRPLRWGAQSVDATRRSRPPAASDSTVRRRGTHSRAGWHRRRPRCRWHGEPANAQVTPGRRGTHARAPQHANCVTPYVAARTRPSPYGPTPSTPSLTLQTPSTLRTLHSTQHRARSPPRRSARAARARWQHRRGSGTGRGCRDPSL